MRSRLFLQVVNGTVGLATVVLGSMQLVLGMNSPIYRSVDLPASAVLDSNLRFFGGMAVGLGLLLLWLLPSIERRSALYRGIWLCAFLGGVGRLVSAWVVGPPSVMLVIFAVVEVAGAGPMVRWQHRVASGFERSR